MAVTSILYEKNLLDELKQMVFLLVNRKPDKLTKYMQVAHCMKAC